MCAQDRDRRYPAGAPRMRPRWRARSPSARAATACARWRTSARRATRSSRRRRASRCGCTASTRSASPTPRSRCWPAISIPMVATIEVFDSYARLRAGPREATALERETVPAALLDSFYPMPDGFSAGSLTSWQELNEQRGAVPHRERAAAARGRRRDLRGQRYAIGCLSGARPAPRAREPRARRVSPRSR